MRGWYRVKAADKLAWHQDLQTDPTLTDVQKSLISVIATNWNGSSMRSECSASFMAKGAGTTTKIAQRYGRALAGSGRVSIAAGPTYTTSTMWMVNWFFRGSAWVRLNNGGKPILDCRTECPTPAEACSVGVVPAIAQVCSVGVDPDRGANSHLKMEIGAPEGAAPFAGPHGVAPRKEVKPRPGRVAGFARWRITHAGYEGEDEDTLVAHLRSSKNSKFVLRCHIDGEEFWSLEQALSFGGDASVLAGELIMMSTNRTGTKSFLRPGPLPWRTVTILAGESTEDGGAALVVRWEEPGLHEGKFSLGSSDAAALLTACGGEDKAVGAMVRYRCMPDDTTEFRLVNAATAEAASKSLDRAASVQDNLEEAA